LYFTLHNGFILLGPQNPLWEKILVALYSECRSRDKWVPVTTAWSVLKLGMKGRPPICRVGEKVVADNRQGVVLQIGGLGEVLTTRHRKNISY